MALAKSSSFGTIFVSIYSTNDAGLPDSALAVGKRSQLLASWPLGCLACLTGTSAGSLAREKFGTNLHCGKDSALVLPRNQGRTAGGDMDALSRPPALRPPRRPPAARWRPLDNQ